MTQKYIIEKEWTLGDYSACVVFNRIGHRCGYVGVNINSIFHGKSYMDEIDINIDANTIKLGKKSPIQLFLSHTDQPRLVDLIDCHGGLTYNGKPYFNSSDDVKWYFGFDCAHYRDSNDINSLKKYFPNYEITEFDTICNFPNSEVRTLEFCINECNSIISQLETLNVFYELNKDKL